MSTYAKADTRSQWYADNYPGSRMTPNCGVLHTTEGPDWPGYEGGALAPNYTAKPDFANKRLLWRAHFPDEMSSRALKNLAGGVETNTLNVVQVELVGTCDDRYRERWGSGKAGVTYIHWPTAPDWALQGLAEFIADQNKRHGIRIQGPSMWLNYGPDPRRPGITPASYGASPARMSFTEWRNFYGWCGHQHVPENFHGDPGGLQWDRIAAMARKIAGVDSTPTPPPVIDSKPVTVRVASWNAGDGPTKTKRADLARLEAGVDVMLLSEFGDRKDVKPRSGFARFFGDKPGAASTPIDYRPSLFVDGTVTKDVELLSPSRRIGAAGPGPAETKPKVANWIRGQLAGNGRWCRFVSFHGVPTPHLNAAREALGRSQVRELASLVEEWQGEGLLVIGGDFNRDGGDPDLDVLEAAGMELVSTGPTHGKNTLDLIYAKRLHEGDKRIAQVKAKVVDGGSSDHESPWVALSVTARP